MSDQGPLTLADPEAAAASEAQTDEHDDRQAPVTESEYEHGRKRPLEAGVKIRGKIKRGTGTRDQDMLLLEGRGENAMEAAAGFEAALQEAEGRGWADRLRELQAETDGGDEIESDQEARDE